MTKKGAWPLFLWLLVLFAGFIGSTAQNMFSTYDFQRWLSVCFFGTLIIVYMAGLGLDTKQKTLAIALPAVLWIGYFFYWSAVGSVDNQLSIQLDAALMLVVLVAITILQTAAHAQPKLDGLIRALVALLAIYYCMVLLRFVLFLMSPGLWNKHILADGFSNVRFLNQCQVMFFPLSIYCQFSKKAPIRYLGWFVSIFTIAFFIYSTARGAMLASLSASLLSLLLMMAIDRSHAWRLLQRIFLVFIFGYLLWYLLFNLLAQWRFYGGESVTIETLFRYGSSGRFSQWREALAASLATPLFGNGGMTFTDPANSFSFIYAHPHNSLVQIFFEYGLVGLFLVLFFFFSVVWAFLKQVLLEKTANPLTIALFFSWLAGLGLSLLSGVVVMPLSQLMLVLITALLCSRLSFHWPALRINKFVVIAVLAALVLQFLTLSYGSYQRIYSQQPLVFDKGPRFWRIGRYLE